MVERRAFVLRGGGRRAAVVGLHHGQPQRRPPLHARPHHAGDQPAHGHTPLSTPTRLADFALDRDQPTTQHITVDTCVHHTQVHSLFPHSHNPEGKAIRHKRGDIGRRSVEFTRSPSHEGIYLIKKVLYHFLRPLSWQSHTLTA